MNLGMVSSDCEQNNTSYTGQTNVNHRIGDLHLFQGPVCQGSTARPLPRLVEKCLAHSDGSNALVNHEID